MKANKNYPALRKNNRKSTAGRITQYIPYIDQNGKIREKCIKHQK